MSPQVLDRIHDALARHRLPGLAVAVDHDGEEIFAAGFGHLDPDRSREIDADTPFGVASLTKFLTAAAIMRQHERGRLSIDQPLSAFYPSLVFAADGSVSLHHLLTHSAGLPGLPCRYHARDIDDPGNRSGGSAQTGLAAVASDPAPTSGLLTASDLAAEINRLTFTPLAPPGELLSYCNEGFCLLGGIIEQTSGQGFAHAARELVLEPLQMTRSFIGPDGMPGDDELALPLLRVAQGFQRGRFWQAPLFYAAGGMVASARDVVRLIRSLGAGQALLSEDSRRQMMAPRMRIASRPGERCAYGFGLEWHRVDENTTILWHSGQRAGVSSFMAHLAEQGLSVSVLCHVAGAPVTSIGHALLGDLLNRSDITWPPGRRATPPGSAGAANRVPDQRFAGRYGSDESGELIIASAEDGLMLRAPSGGEPARLRFDTQDSGIVGDQTFRFLRDRPGAPPWALALDLRVLRRYPAGDQTMSGSNG